MITDNDCLTPLGLILGSLNQGDYWQCHAYLSLPPRTAAWSWGYLVVFALTNLLEFPVYFALLAGLGPSARNWRSAKEMMKTCLSLNLATHPLIYFAFPAFLLSSTYRNYLISAELFAPGVEAMLLATVFKRHWAIALLAAVTANLFSWWLGVYLT